MIITITKAEKLKGDYGEYVKVAGFDGKGNEIAKNVSAKFEDKWDLLKENATLEFKMVQGKDKKWNIADITVPNLPPSIPLEVKPKAQALSPPPVKSQVPPETEKPKPPLAITDQEKRIIRSTAAKCVSWLVAGGKIGIEDMTRWLKKFEKYIIEGAKEE